MIIEEIGDVDDSLVKQFLLKQETRICLAPFNNAQYTQMIQTYSASPQLVHEIPVYANCKSGLSKASLRALFNFAECYSLTDQVICNFDGEASNVITLRMSKFPNKVNDLTIEFCGNSSLLLK